MTYRKPQLSGQQAISVIQGSNKQSGNSETQGSLSKTQPAYEADE